MPGRTSPVTYRRTLTGKMKDVREARCWTCDAEMAGAGEP